MLCYFFSPVIIFLCHLSTTPYDILFGSRVTNCYLANIWHLGSLQITDRVFDLTWPRPATKLLFLSSSWYFLWDSLSTEVLDLSSCTLTTDLTWVTNNDSPPSGDCHLPQTGDEMTQKGGLPHQSTAKVLSVLAWTWRPLPEHTDITTVLPCLSQDSQDTHTMHLGHFRTFCPHWIQNLFCFQLPCNSTYSLFPLCLLPCFVCF